MLQWSGLLVFIIIQNVCGSCLTKEFMPCVVQLNSQRVPFDTNIMHVIYNISTEAKLIHTCRGYERVFSCFAQRMSSCGNKAQRNMLDKGKRLHTYLCAPFSLQRQKIFLRSSTCIQSVLRLPMDSKCEKPETLMTQKLHSCRSKCGDDLPCNTKVDISEVAACTYLKIEKVCGEEASQFYAQMQQVISNREFPVQCSYTLKGSTRQPVTKTTTVTPMSSPTFATTVQFREPRKKTTPYYFSTSYITVYPDGIGKHNGVSRKESQAPKVRTRTNFSKLFTPMKAPNISNIPVLPGAALSTSSIGTTNFSFTIPPPTRPILHSSTIPPAHKLPAPTSTIAPTLALPGARPIPETTVFVPGSFSSVSSPNQLASKKFQFSMSTTPGGEKFIPWYHNNKEAGSAPTNPMISPFMDVPPYPTLIPPIMSNDFPQSPSNPKIILEHVTPSPFKININWMDGTEESVWYQQNVPTQRKPDKEEAAGGPFEVVTPLLNHFKTKPLNFTEMSNQASDYFNAALSALESVADESRAATADNNPWRTFIDAVVPTVHKISPNIIPRIRQEMERIESQGGTHGPVQ